MHPPTCVRLFRGLNDKAEIMPVAFHLKIQRDSAHVPEGWIAFNSLKTVED
jgi:hypothetical protein